MTWAPSLIDDVPLHQADPCRLAPPPKAETPPVQDLSPAQTVHLAVWLRRVLATKKGGAR
jgi:hypothetical protein